MVGNPIFAHAMMTKGPDMKFHIENMTCGGCVRGVTAAIRAVDPQARIEADPETRRVEVTSSADRAHLVVALKAAGFATA